VTALNTAPKPDADKTSTLLKDRIRGVFRRLPKSLAGEEEAVHQVRVAGRRLRVALPLLARKPDGRRVTRALEILRQLTRAAGMGRDLDVIVPLFDQRMEALEAPSPEHMALRRRLRASRRRARTRMAEALMDIEIARVRRDLRRVVGRKAEGVFTVMARLRDARDAEGALLLAGFEEIGDRYDPERLHALRRRARRLRYTAEVGDALRAEETEAPAILKGVQDAIGVLHDHQVLVAWLRRQAAASRAPALAAAAQEELSFFEERSRELHAQLLESRPGEAVRRALEAMGQTRTAA
jgi:CHAD domain-containing protein